MSIRYKKIIVSALLISVLVTGGVGSVFAQETSTTVQQKKQQNQDTKYPKEVMKTVRVALGEDAKSTKMDPVINKLSKVAVMDYYLVSFGKKVKGNEIRRAVEDIFFVELNTVSKKNYGSKLIVYCDDIMANLRVSLNEAPTSKVKDEQIMNMKKNEVMDRYVKEQNYALTGAASRQLINGIYGVNLEGISKLEFKQIAIYSKGQWIIKSDKDLFSLTSSLDDVDVSISTTPYFKELTGSDQLPETLKAQLESMGFTYRKEKNSMYYNAGTGNSVSDEFKNSVMKILIETVSTQFQK